MPAETGLSTDLEVGRHLDHLQRMQSPGRHCECRVQQQPVHGCSAWWLGCACCERRVTRLLCVRAGCDFAQPARARGHHYRHEVITPS